ncbi:hypothetical protein WDA79_20520 [Streptomyces sp. A475]
MTSPRPARGSGAVTDFSGDGPRGAGDRSDTLGPGRPGDLGGAVR